MAAIGPGDPAYNDQFDRAMKEWRTRRRLERRERLRTTAMWCAAVATMSSPLVTYFLMR